MATMATDDGAAVAVVGPPSRRRPAGHAVIYNQRGILDTLADFEYPATMPFTECLAVTTAELESVPDVNDDFQREKAFEAHALASALTARKQLLAAGIPFARPDDYFAEMLKTDTQMHRIRTKLAQDSQAIDRAEEARRMRTQRMFTKQVHAHVKETRAKDARNLADRVADFKRRRKAGGNRDDGDNELDFDVTAEPTKAPVAKKRMAHLHRKQIEQEQKSTVNPKRLSKNEQHGFGGRKRGIKRNTADSAAEADFGGKNRRRAQPLSSGKKKPQQQRPGGARRKRTMAAKKSRA